MNILVLVLLAIYFLPLYVMSWVVYFAYNFGVVAILPTLITIQQVPIFLTIVFLYVVIRFIMITLSKKEDLDISRFMD